MTLFAFLAPMPAPKAEAPALPEFKPRSWYRPDRLDARPVTWSLRNHPEEWVWGNTRRFTIIHKPSKHEFWVSLGSYHLWRADCSCRTTEGKFQFGQTFAFARAFRWWRRNYGTPRVDEQFASHFIH